jgi:phosphopantothenoylcysteine decarboxylase / phosphopantothenate---cysteine ligase
VADYRPIVVSEQKIKKTDSDDLVLELTKNPDIIDLLGRVKRKDQLIVGFAAESEDLLKHAEQKLKRKQLDIIIGNDITVPDTGFGSDYNAVVVLSADGSRENLPRMPKRAIAEHICDLLAQRLFSPEKSPAIS